MKFTAIKTNVDVTNVTALEGINKNENIFPLEISAYIEEEYFSRHITINISPDKETDGFDIWLDLDICQAELLAMKIKELCINRRSFLLDKMKEE